MYLCNGRAGVIDLFDGKSSEQDLPEGSLMKGSALSVAEELLEEHGDAVVLGTGLLTGSLVPAACAGFVMSGKGTMPLLGFSGVELKLAGFDFMVIKGESPAPGYVWVRDGIAEFVAAPDMPAIDSWARTDKIRSDQGDRRIQVVSVGPWGDAQRPSSSLVVNHWLGEDDAFLGPEFGRRRLAAVAFRGMGEFEVSDAEGHLAASLSLRADHASKLGGSKGLASYWDRAGDSGFSSLLHRVVSCFGCPYPCRSYLKVNEDPGQMALSAGEPGYLHFDLPSLEAAASSGMDFKDATFAFMDCAKAGADPSSVIGAASKDLPGVKAILASGMASPVDRSSRSGSFRSCAEFDKCMALGLCPRYWAKAGLDMGAVSRCAEPALGHPLG